MQALQGKLDTMVGTPSGYIQVSLVVVVLGGVQSETPP
jgi:hypothetical protein